jgi:hypothetical protein
MFQSLKIDNYNEIFFNLTGNYTNLKRTSIIYFAGEIKEVVTKFLITVDVSTPDVTNPEVLGKSIFRSSMQLEKMLNGRGTNPIMKLIMMGICNTIMPPIKMPIIPGSYHLPDFTFPEVFSIGVIPDTRFQAEVKFHAKVDKKPKMNYINKIVFRGVVVV